MQRFHVKRGDPVVVISGSHRGKEGKILEILPAKGRLWSPSERFRTTTLGAEAAPPPSPAKSRRTAR